MMRTRAPLILGHRGASAECPENTLIAFQRAIDVGGDGIECDVQRAADGTLVLIHDDDVARTTDGRGQVGALGWNTLSALDAGAGERIPLLSETLAWASELARSGSAPFLNLELKMPGVGPATLAALATSGYRGQVALSSFDYPTLIETRRLDSAVELWRLSSTWREELLAEAEVLGATSLALRHEIITAEIAECAVAAGLKIVAWTVDAPADINRLLELDAPLHALISNRPDMVAETLSRVASSNDQS